MSPKYTDWQAGATGKRRKKSTKPDWCRGKSGVPHVTSLVMPKGVSLGCRPSYVYSPKGKQEYWQCYHQQVCQECGKVLREQISPERCPDRQGAS